MDTVNFHESGLTVRVLESPADQHKAFALRHTIYCETLNWVKTQTDALERDDYEEGSTSLGVMTEDDELLGVVRMIPAGRPFMLEHGFQGLLDPLHRLRKCTDTAEVTRLTTRTPPKTYASAAPISCLLYKAIYRWSCAHHVRYLYLVVETHYLRTLQQWGFPCLPIGLPRLLGPRSLCIAAILDWDLFRERIEAHPSPFTAWITDHRSKTQAPPPLLWRGRGFAPSTSA